MSVGNIKGGRAAAWVVAGLVVAALVVPEVVAAQCAMCRTALLNSPEGQQMAGGFNRAILFLLSAPFVVTAAVAFLIFRARRGRVPLAGDRARIVAGWQSQPMLRGELEGGKSSRLSQSEQAADHPKIPVLDGLKATEVDQ